MHLPRPARQHGDAVGERPRHAAMQDVRLSEAEGALDIGGEAERWDTVEPRRDDVDAPVGRRRGASRGGARYLVDLVEGLVGSWAAAAAAAVELRWAQEVLDAQRGVLGDVEGGGEQSALDGRCEAAREHALHSGS